MGSLTGGSGWSSKTPTGARRRTILVSVLEPLRLHLPEFTLPHLFDEIGNWLTHGTGRFQKQLTTADLPPPANPALPRLVPALKAAQHPRSPLPVRTMDRDWETQGPRRSLASFLDCL
ncbi:MAG: hypothetical protein ACK5Q5_19295 [Planctomycetaceae bacterium]